MSKWRRRRKGRRRLMEGLCGAGAKGPLLVAGEGPLPVIIIGEGPLPMAGEGPLLVAGEGLLLVAEGGPFPLAGEGPLLVAGGEQESTRGRSNATPHHGLHHGG